MKGPTPSPSVPLSDRCLHLVMRAQPEVLDRCFACCAPHDTVVLMDAAVVLCVRPDPRMGEAPEFPIELCCVESDVRARGIEKLLRTDSCVLISDQELVEKVARHRHCLSWK